jgi:predicted ArsR family transcriptional regulator
VSAGQLAARSGLSRHQVRQFIEMLDAHGLLSHREGAEDDSLFGSLRPFGGWLRRALAASHDRR